jgi:poly(A) polymerase/tRNA nucleotidyltransferase (CCA-adding enzyme)
MSGVLTSKKLEFEADALKVLEKLKQKNFPSYFVGGALRDLLLGRTGGDIDIATAARPDEVSKLFSHAIPTGIKHGTVTVVQNSKAFEITTFRKDGRYSDGRHPDEVEFGTSLPEDLARRDFTINALAYDPATEELVDLFDGQGDLKNKIIRCIGNPAERFEEDALRMLRACRFASQLGFSIEKHTLEAIHEQREKLKLVSVERIREELVKIIMSPKPSIGLEACRVTKLLDLFLPELKKCFGVSQNTFHRYDVYYHTLHVLDAFEGLGVREPSVRIAGLFHDIAKPQTKRQVSEKAEPVFYNHEVVGASVAKGIMRRLKFSNEEVADVTHLVRQHMFHYTDEWSKGAIRRFIRTVGEDYLPWLFQLRDADRLGNGKRELHCDEIEEFKVKIKEIFDEDSALQIKDLKVDGGKLMTFFHLEPGRIIGEILHHLLEKVLDEPELNTEEKLLEEAKSFIDLKNNLSK